MTAFRVAGGFSKYSTSWPLAGDAVGFLGTKRQWTVVLVAEARLLRGIVLVASHNLSSIRNCDGARGGDSDRLARGGSPTVDWDVPCEGRVSFPPNRGIPC